MSYSQAKVTIDIDEYNELLGIKKTIESSPDKYKLCLQDVMGVLADNFSGASFQANDDLIKVFKRHSVEIVYYPHISSPEIK